MVKKRTRHQDQIPVPHSWGKSGFEVGYILETRRKERRGRQSPRKSSKIAVQTIKCRVCGGDHYTAKCPFKDTLGAAAGVTPSGTTQNLLVKVAPVQLVQVNMFQDT